MGQLSLLSVLLQVTGDCQHTLCWLRFSIEDDQGSTLFTSSFEGAFLRVLSLLPELMHCYQHEFMHQGPPMQAQHAVHSCMLMRLLICTLACLLACLHAVAACAGLLPLQGHHAPRREARCEQQSTGCSSEGQLVELWCGAAAHSWRWRVAHTTMVFGAPYWVWGQRRGLWHASWTPCMPQDTNSLTLKELNT